MFNQMQLRNDSTRIAATTPSAARRLSTVVIAALIACICIQTQVAAQSQGKPSDRSVPSPFVTPRSGFVKVHNATTAAVNIIPKSWIDENGKQIAFAPSVITIRSGESVFITVDGQKVKARQFAFLMVTGEDVSAWQSDDTDIIQNGELTVRISEANLLEHARIIHDQRNANMPTSQIDYSALLSSVDLSSFDLRMLSEPYLATQLSNTSVSRARAAIQQASQAAQSRLGSPPTPPNYGNGSFELYNDLVRSYWDDVKSQTDREIKAATRSFIYTQLTATELTRLRQLWLQLRGPSPVILSGLGFPPTMQADLLDGLRREWLAAIDGKTGESMYAAAACTVQQIMKKSLSAPQHAQWQVLIGTEVAGLR